MTSPLTIRIRPAWKGWPLFHRTHGQELSKPYRRSDRVIQLRLFNRRLEVIHWNLPADGTTAQERERQFFREISVQELGPAAPQAGADRAEPPA